MEKRCWSCRKELYEDEFVYHSNWHWMCRECFEDYLEETIETDDIADALGIVRRNVTEISADELQESLEEER